jgi:hypothetical protein
VRAASRYSWAATIAAVIGFAPTPAGAQAFTPPAQVGSVTFAWQWVSNTGHFMTDGFLLKAGPSVTSSGLVEVDYGITERFAATAGLPYVFAKYTGALPPFSQLEIDSCKCWHSAFQDFSIGGRYRLGDEFWAITPQVRYSHPTHNYAFEGEAVVGRNLQELQIGVSTALRLTSVLPRASVQANYTYSIVEKPLADVSINRSTGYFDVGYPLTRSLYARGSANWQVTHGGLSFGSITGKPFFPPGELNTPARYAQRDRVLRTTYWHAGGGLSYSTGLVDVFVSVEKYLWGHNAHNGIAYTIGSTWYFDFSKPVP